MSACQIFPKKVITLYITIAASGLWLWACAANAQTFVNGGFEDDAWPVGSNAGLAPTGWTTTHSGNGNWPYAVHNDADLTEENTPFGDQFVELCAKDCRNSPPVGSISQTVSGFVVGQQYRLTFQHAPEVHPEAPIGFEESIVNVSIAGGTPASTDFSGNAVGGYFTEWTLQSLDFTANATSLTFTFTGVDAVTDDSRTESGIDEVSVTRLSSAPPPPASPAMPIPTLSFYGLVLILLGLVMAAIWHFWASSRRR